MTLCWSSSDLAMVALLSAKSVPTHRLDNYLLILLVLFGFLD